MARPSAARRPPASPTPSSPPPAGASARHGQAKAAAPWRPATVDLAAPPDAEVAVVGTVLRDRLELSVTRSYVLVLFAKAR